MTLDWQNLFASILPFFPAKIASDLTLVGTFLVSLCAILARFWSRPTSESSWLAAYLLINSIGMNSRHAANADDTTNAHSNRNLPVTPKPEITK